MQGDRQATGRDEVLVTGANGYLGTRIVVTLLDAGHPVRASVRNQDRAAELLADLARAGHDGRGVRVVETQLDSDGGWAEAVAGVRHVIHVASPFPAGTPEHEDEIVVPARDGALRVLRAARDEGVSRVVLTSSYAAVGYSPTAEGDAVLTEEDWTDPAADLQPYIKSKTVAERAAWDFVAREGGDLELAVVNPVGIFGPVLGPRLSTSTAFIKAMLDGSVDSVPRQHFGVVDVRDAAALHLLAMTAPAAAGERFIAVADGPSVSFLEIADMLRESLGELGSLVPRAESAESSDGADPLPRPTISNAKAEDVLGWRPRSVRETVLDTATSLEELGLVGGR